MAFHRITDREQNPHSSARACEAPAAQALDADTCRGRLAGPFGAPDRPRDWGPGFRYFIARKIRAPPSAARRTEASALPQLHRVISSVRSRIGPSPRFFVPCWFRNRIHCSASRSPSVSTRGRWFAKYRTSPARCSSRATPSTGARIGLWSKQQRRTPATTGLWGSNGGVGLTLRISRSDPRPGSASLHRRHMARPNRVRTVSPPRKHRSSMRRSARIFSPSTRNVFAECLLAEFRAAALEPP